MAAHHGKSVSARHPFTCIFTTQVSPFEAARQFAKQIHSAIYVSKEGVGVWERWVSIGAQQLSREGLEAGCSEGKQIFSLARTAQRKHAADADVY